jgi:diaminohydroxyphosphoribosylaminopyrimidine deaminase/5-amino-6-(5-phosphoribosylamino)uracil reductase
MSPSRQDEFFMERALDLAAKAVGRTSPNPVVGAVIVRGGRVIGEGFHHRAGLPHAEIEALRNVKSSAKGATLYVNLEPCSHYGRTPPCVDAVLEAELHRVVVGMVDPNPNPLVRGQGIRRLRRAGVEVQIGVLRERCERLNEDFAMLIQTGKPMVTLKLAASLDGRIATANGDSKWISGEVSRHLVHEMRNRVDAILVGAGTVHADNPQLTCRIRGGRDPLRVILDGRLSISPTARVCTQASSAKTLIATTENNRLTRRRRELEKKGVEVLCFPGERGHLPFLPLLQELGRRGVKHVMIEGGGQVAAAALKEGVIDKVLFFYGPNLLGGEGKPMVGLLGVNRVAAGLKLHTIELHKLKDDVLVCGYIRKKRG